MWYSWTTFSAMSSFSPLSKAWALALLEQLNQDQDSPLSCLRSESCPPKKKDWGIKAYTTASKDVLCLVWQDLGTTQMMTTVHSVEDIEISEFILSQKRRSIPLDSVIETPESNKVLPIPLPIREYNKHMGGSDANAQCRSYYSANTRCFRYQWPLFQFLLDASVLNAFNLWKMLQPNSAMSHIDFQHLVDLKLTQTPLAISRKHAPQLKLEGKYPMINLPTHHFVRLEKKTYCDVEKPSYPAKNSVCIY